MGKSREEKLRSKYENILATPVAEEETEDVSPPKMGASNISDELEIECTLLRDRVEINAENYRNSLLIKLYSHAEFLQAMPLNAVMIMDVSGSMKQTDVSSSKQERRLDYISKAAQAMMPRLTPQDQIAIVAFAKDAKIISQTQPVKDPNVLCDFFKRMERDGFGIDDTDTFLDQGLTLALAEARKSYSSEYVNRILVLTDGETRNAERCLEIAEDAVKDGISFSTFGVGTTWNEDLLTKISNLGQGNWYYIDEDQINRAEELFDQEFTGLQSTVLSNVVLHLRDLRPWTSVLRAQRVYPDIDELPFDTSAPNLVTVTVGTLQKNKEVYVLIDLKHNMAQNEGEYGLVKVSAHFDLPAQKLKDISTPEKEVRLNFIPGQRGASFDAEVAKFVRTVEINDGWKQVNELIAQGNKAEAARVLSKIHRISERTGDKEKTKFIGGAKDEFDETGTISKKTKLDVKDKARNTKVFKPEWEDEQE